MAQNPDLECGIHRECRREIPTWLVLLDNIPTAILFALGAALLWLVWWPLSAAFLVYCAAAIVLFWAIICTHCHHFGTRACPCGYGVMAQRFFRSKRETAGRDFRTVFRRNIVVVFPCWLVPLVAGLWLVWRRPSLLASVLLAAFCVVGFVLIPLISILVGCRACEIKNDCPWMTRKR